MYTTSKTARYFMLLILGVSLLGIVMVYSASYIYAKETFGSPYHLFLKQLTFLAIGIGGMVFISKIKFDFIYNNILLVHAFFIFLLLLTLVPHVGVFKKGGQRWIDFLFFSLQPGELVKYSFLLTSISFFRRMDELPKKQIILYGLSFVIPLAILLKQPDFGTFSICLIGSLFVCFLSDFPRKYFYGLLATGLIALTIIIGSAPYRIQRILSYLDPWKDPQNGGFQIIQSYLAFANGSFWGAGIGNSKEKLFYLPEAHNDFIFSVIGEELGLAGVFLIVFLFIGIIYFGLRLALEIKSKAGSLYCASVVFIIGLQTFLNMGVVLGLLPTKGLNLPFISSGGSSLIANLLAIGPILYFSKNNQEDNSQGKKFQASNRNRFEYK